MTNNQKFILGSLRRSSKMPHMIYESGEGVLSYKSPISFRVDLMRMRRRGLIRNKTISLGRGVPSTNACGLVYIYSITDKGRSLIQILSQGKFETVGYQMIPTDKHKARDLALLNLDKAYTAIQNKDYKLSGVYLGFAKRIILARKLLPGFPMGITQ